MPNWKKLIVSGSDAELNSLNIATALTASGLLYPTTDGSENQALITDGVGNLSFGIPISSSYALTASYIDIEDGVFSGSFSGSFYGDGSNLTGIPIDQVTTFTSSFTNVTSTIVNHNFDSKNLLVSIYDTNDSQIIPETVTLTDNDNLSINFAITSSGYVVVAKGGHIVSGSANNAVSSSYAATASYINSTGVDGPLGMDSVTSASYAISASYADNFFAVSASVASFSASYIDLDVLADGDMPPHKTGRIFFGAEDGALEVYNEEADITLQVGQEFWVRAFNPTDSTILNGTPVRASGSQGDRIDIYPALAEDHTTGVHFDSHIIGVATHDIETSSEGYVTTQGIVRGVDTTAFSAGDTLYLQTGSAGLRNSPPPFPYDIVQVGYASKIGSNGFIFVYTKEPVHFSNISGLSGSNGGPGDLWIYQANNAWSPGKVLSGSYTINNGGLTADSFTGSFTGSFVGDGSGLTGINTEFSDINSNPFSSSTQSGISSGSLTEIATLPTSSYLGAFFDYSAYSGSNARAGTLRSVQLEGTIVYNEVSTTDIGNTDGLTLSIIVTGGNFSFNALTDSDGWTVNSLARGI
jgi:hypothetical protein